MSDFNSALNRFQTPAISPWQVSLPPVTLPATTQRPLGTDQLQLSSLVTGGAGPVPAAVPVATGPAPTDPQAYAQFVSDTIAMMTSADPKQRFQSIINMTKMQPAEAIPLLQQAIKNDNPQVVQLAQQALNVMQQMPAAVGATTAPATATPPVAVPATAVAVPAPPAAAPAPTTPSVSAGAQVQAFASQIGTGNHEQGIQAILQLEQLAGSDRQEVVSTLLKQIDASNFINLPSASEQIAAISALKDLKATEAVPILQAVIANGGFTAAVHNAAASAIQNMAAQGGSGGVSQNAQVQALASQIGTGTDQQGIQAILQLEQLAVSDRQGVINVLLKKIDMRDFIDLPSAPQQQAAIAALKDLNATEAIPFLTVIVSSPSFNPAVQGAARNALGQIHTPAAATALPTAPVQAPAPSVSQPSAALTPAPTLTARGPGSSVPGFLQH